MLERRGQEASRDRITRAHQLRRGTFGDHVSATTARARAEIDHMGGAADGVLVMFHHDQRVALGLELGQCVEQDAIVARVQADGWLIEDVAHPAQIRTQLRGEANALRLTAR